MSSKDEKSVAKPIATLAPYVNGGHIPCQRCTKRFPVAWLLNGKGFHNNRTGESYCSFDCYLGEDDD